MKRLRLAGRTSGARRLSLTGPGLIAAIGALILLGDDPGFLVIFALVSLPGLIVALVLRFTIRDVMPAREDDRGGWGPNMSRISFSGGAGLLFTLGSMAIFFVALPPVRWFLALSLPVAIGVALILHFAHQD